MGLFSRLSTVMRPASVHADGDPFAGMYRGFVPPEWIGALSAAGVHVTPELSLTLSAMYGGVTMIALDLASCPMQTFARRDDGGKDRITGRSTLGQLQAAGIGDLAYRLRWQPNDVQTAAEYYMAMIAQWLLRSIAYAEIRTLQDGSYRLLPRHPDRVHQETTASGAKRYRLTEPKGREPRYLSQDEMHVVRQLSFDMGEHMQSLVKYGADAIGTALATQRAAGKFFRSGMTAAKIATYKGEMTEEEEAGLHASISRFAAGVENSFGLALIPDDVTITNLGVEPEKAQMMLAQEWGIREVARLLRLPGHKLGLRDSVAYSSQVQAALDYVISTLRPIAVSFEQAQQRDLIIDKDDYLTEFQLAGLLRGDFETQANYIEKLIRNRVIRPSEARLILNMNPDAALDKLSEGDFRPGSSGGASNGARAAVVATMGRTQFRAMLAVHDNAVRCIRRERVAVEKLAKKHPSDVEAWQRSLREFYADHAAFVAQTMRLPMDAAREYAAQHGLAFEASGVAIIDGVAGEQWERHEAEELAALAVCIEAVAA